MLFTWIVTFIFAGGAIFETIAPIFTTLEEFDPLTSLVIIASIATAITTWYYLDDVKKFFTDPL